MASRIVPGSTQHSRSPPARQKPSAPFQNRRNRRCRLSRFALYPYCSGVLADRSRYRALARLTAELVMAEAAAKSPASQAGSDLAKQKQDQQNNNHEAEAAAAIVASTVKRTAANSTKATQQCDHQNDENDGPNRHFRLSFILDQPPSPTGSRLGR